MTLEQFRKMNPGCYVDPEGTGKWLVVFCRGRGVRYDSEFAARQDARQACVRCSDGSSHRIIELQIDEPFRMSKSMRKFMEAQ